MEKATAVVVSIGIVCAAALMLGLSMMGHEDNNRQKQVVIECIHAGGNPQFEDEQFLGCER